MRTDVQRMLRLLSAAALCASCTGSASQNTQPPRLASDIGEVPDDMMSDYRSFASNCSKCHDLDRALTAPVTDNRHWDIYVAKMMRTAGSAINANEAPHILRFLYWYTDRKTARAREESGKTIDQDTAAPEKGGPPRVNEEEVNTTGAGPHTEAAPVPSVTSETEGEGTP